MTKPPPIVWRIAAAVLWIVSIVCLVRAITGATTVEEWTERSSDTAAEQLLIRHQAEIADRSAAVGWLFQLATAAVLSFGLNSRRAVRRIFVSLGILIAVDGVTLLLVVIIIPR